MNRPTDSPATPMLTYEPIDISSLHDGVSDPATGAVVTFVGTTRGITGAKQTERLAYESYESMALAELKQLQDEAARRWHLTTCKLMHRLGEVPVGEASVAVLAAAPHRDEAFAAARWLIDTLKERVPIWKREHYADGTSQWQHPSAAAPAGEANR